MRTLLAERKLESAGSFIFDDIHDPAARERLLDIAERVSRLIAASGGTILSLIDKPDDVRVATAGRPDAAPRFDADRWGQMVDQLNALAAVARKHGVQPVVHPHVGGYIEFEDEIERLVADTDLDLTLDTGHLAYARMDPAVVDRALRRPPRARAFQGHPSRRAGARRRRAPHVLGGDPGRHLLPGRRRAGRHR